MNVTQFFRLCLGRWRSQRSGHNLVRGGFEELCTTIVIRALSADDRHVLNLCRWYDVSPEAVFHPLDVRSMGDRGGAEDNYLLVPLPDPDNPNRGKMLRSRPDEGSIHSCIYRLHEDDTMTIVTEYERAATEERIWFASPNLRLRVSTVRMEDSGAIATTTFASDVRDLAATFEERNRVSTAVL